MPVSHRRSDVSLSIGAVSSLTSVEIHTLRYWEREFDDFLSPGRTGGGQRRYSAEDIATVLEIKRLLRQEQYSIAGARRVLLDAAADRDLDRAA